MVVIASSSTAPTTLAKLTISADRKSVATETIKVASDASIDLGYISEAVPITFPTKKIGQESDDESVAHGFYYEPVNRDFKGIEGELPPLILHCHGALSSTSDSSFCHSYSTILNRRANFGCRKWLLLCDTIFHLERIRLRRC